MNKCIFHFIVVGVPDERHDVLANSFSVQVLGSAHVDTIEIDEQTYIHTVLYTLNQQGNIELGGLSCCVVYYSYK